MNEQQVIEIGGREFEFARITLANNAKIMRTMKKDIQYFTKKDWIRFCRIALKMNFLWKWFHIMPKELGWNKIDLAVAGGLQVDFFSRYKEGLEKEFKRLESLGLIKPNEKP
jgi:hypothetical protein